MANDRFYAVTTRGLETVLLQEARRLHLDRVKLERNGVSFMGGPADAMRAMAGLRTASRVLMPLISGKCDTFDALYELALQVPWTEHLHPGMTLAVDVSALRPVLEATHLAALKVKDAVVDVVRDATGTRPDVNPQAPDLPIHLLLDGDYTRISLDLAGDALGMRGYRVMTTPAPLKETLAAGLLRLARWTPNIPLVDPMCGSGTLLIEAALQAQGASTFYHRRSPLALERHPQWGEEARQARAQLPALNANPPVKLLGFDRDPEALEAARANAVAAGVDHLIQFAEADVHHPPLLPLGAMLITNPPYGERLGSDLGVLSLYRVLGGWIRKAQPAEAWFFCAHPHFEYSVGQAPVERHRLFNGPIETWFFGYKWRGGARRLGEVEERPDNAARGSKPSGGGQKKGGWAGKGSRKEKG